MCTAAASCVASLTEPARVKSAGLMYLKCLILRKLFEGVVAAQWFNIKYSLVVLWKKEKHFFWYRKYHPKSVRCHKTESKSFL